MTTTPPASPRLAPALRELARPYRGRLVAVAAGQWAYQLELPAAGDGWHRQLPAQRRGGGERRGGERAPRASLPAALARLQ